MATISRYEFMGNWLYFWLLCITGIGIPLALLYLLNGTIHVQDEIQDPELLLNALRKRR